VSRKHGRIIEYMRLRPKVSGINLNLIIIQESGK